MSKALWGILLVLTGVLALWWGVIAVGKNLTYWRLSEEVSATVQEMDIIPRGSKFALRAAYSYSHSGKSFTSSALFKKPYHLNRRSAEQEVEALRGMKWTAWVDTAHPEISSLQKDFPLKESLYAACLICIFFYFLYLKFHLQQFSRAL